MRRLSTWERWWSACVLASLLAHLLLLWGVDYWLGLDAEQGFKAQLQPPDHQPYRLKRRLALPPGKRAFAGRPSTGAVPRPLQGLSPGTAEEYLERGIPQGLAAQGPAPDLYSSYQGTDTLLVHPEWEGLALQAWRDSLSLALKSGGTWEGLQPLDPFEIETLARGQGRAVAVLDSAGQLVRAYCTLPIYGIYVPRANKMNFGGRSGRNDYADFFHGLRKWLRELSQTSPLDIVLDDHYRVEADSTHIVPFDPIHQRGEFPHRDVLALEQLRQYPVVSLQLIDVESTPTLMQYLLEGGFALMDQKQLDRLTAELSTHAGLQVRQFDLDPSHPLMSAYYSLAGQHVRGVETNGRIVAATGSSLVNAIVFALMQPGSLAVRFAEH